MSDGLVQVHRELSALQTTVKAMDTRIGTVESDLKALLAVANMGKGAWWLILRLGGLALLLAGAIAWVVDHWPFRTPPH